MAEPIVNKPILRENLPDTSELDQALEQIDPDFAKNLQSIESVAAATDVNIETAQIDVDDVEPTEEKKKRSFKNWLNQKKLAFKARFIRNKTRFLLFAKTVPKELAVAAFLSSQKGFKNGLDFTKWVIKTYSAYSRIQKIAIFGVAGMIVTTTWIVIANIKGRWIPPLNDPLLTSFESRADSVVEFDPKQKMVSFARVFPQDPEIFLFDKIIVNLRRTAAHPNPMGGFEIYAQVDSHETAIELQTRQVEIHDIAQRVFEGIAYEELVSDLGKNRLKGLMKSEIDKALTQGWVVDIHFKSFILKP